MLRPKQREFIAALRDCGNVALAARAAKCHRSDHYEWLTEAEYAESFEDAREEAIELLEGEARRRAYLGREEPVVYQGELQFKRDRTGRRTKEVLTIPRVSDTLLIFLLKAARPETYRDNLKVEHSGELQLIVQKLAEGRARIAAISE